MAKATKKCGRYKVKKAVLSSHRKHSAPSKVGRRVVAYKGQVLPFKQYHTNNCYVITPSAAPASMVYSKLYEQESKDVARATTVLSKHAR